MRKLIGGLAAVVLAAALAAGCGGGNKAGSSGAEAAREPGKAAGSANKAGDNAGGGTQGGAVDPDTPVSSDGSTGGNSGGGSAAGGGTSGSSGSSPGSAGTGEIAAASAEEAAKAAVNALKAKDLETLNKLIHPDKGVLFSPYAHIDTKTAVVFQADGLPSLEQENAYTWGSYDGSGEPITLSFGEYYGKFVYDKDFAAADEIGKDEVIGKGNTAVNVKDIFPDGTFFDYYVKGTDESAEGMDWASLILVLEQKDGRWYVSAVVHNQWTI